jgi:hypothetical protein
MVAEDQDGANRRAGLPPSTRCSRLFSAMNYVAPYITGRYDFTLVPIPLPTAYVESLLPPTSSLLTPSELASLDLDVPPAGDGNSWVTLEVGQQIKTGMAIPGGKSTFYVRLPLSTSDLSLSEVMWTQEAKLQIPFIAPQGRTAAITYKHTLLFSSLLMRYSSSLLTGLDSYHSKFDKREGGYSVGDWMEVRAGESGEGGWGEELVRACVGGWWIGSGTKGNALRVSLSLGLYDCGGD